MRRLVLFALLSACRGSPLTGFDHRAHLAEHPSSVGLVCRTCHVLSHGGFTPPGAKSCAGCHTDGQQKWSLAVRPALAVQPAGKSIVFSHDVHLAQGEIKGQCVKCHAGAVGFQSGPALFPPMSTCLGCHRHQEQFEQRACLGCHQLKDLKKLQPTSFLPHDAAWMRRHAGEARDSAAMCSLCHAQTQCDGCHDATKRLGPAQLKPEQIDKSFVHRFDFVSRHALEARSQPGSCASCHVQTECNACHASRGVGGAVRGAVSPHPQGWASGLVSNTHGPAARRDIASCAACHDQGAASNCVQCHKVGGTGGSPHPRGWRSSEPIGSAACAPCHRGGP
jgi:hypothetical protein